MARWLTTGVLVALGCAVPRPASAQQASFADVTFATELWQFTSYAGDFHGPGAVFADLNNDHYPDIYTVGPRTGGVYQPNELLLNVPLSNPIDGLTRTFQRVPDQAGAGDYDPGLGGGGAGIGALSADYDNDGDQDLYVINWDSSDDYVGWTLENPTPPVSTFRDMNRLYRNELIETGTFGFTDVTASTNPTPGVADDQHGVGWQSSGGIPLTNSLTAAWADVDRDGFLDLYVGTHYGTNFNNPPNGQRDTFYRNNGNGTFTDATMEAGVPGFETARGEYTAPDLDFSSSNAVIFADFNNDRWPDLMVTNKVGKGLDRDMLYINQGNDVEGNWQGYETVTYTMPTTFGDRSKGAMGVVVADYEHDGDLDIYITDWSSPGDYPDNGRNALWINQLSDTGTLDFVFSLDFDAVYSWGAQWEDFDNNGYEDLYIATHNGINGFLHLGSENGYTGDVATASGLSAEYNSRGAMGADFDRDGLLDLFVVNPWNDISVLHHNRSDTLAGNEDYGFLVIKLEGDPTLPGQFKSSRDAIGARVNVWTDIDGSGTVEADEWLIREVASGSSAAASTSSLELEFGLGLGAEALVEILWPSGRRTLLDSIAADSQIVVREILGDFDENGLIGLGDYAFWRDMRGMSVQPGSGADADGDGLVTEADYALWVAGFGTSAVEYLSFGGGNAAGAAVPEPATGGLALLALAVLSHAARRSTSLRSSLALRVGSRTNSGRDWISSAANPKRFV